MKKRRRSFASHAEPTCCGQEFLSVATRSSKLVSQLVEKTFVPQSPVPSRCRMLLTSAERYFQEGMHASKKGNCAVAATATQQGERDLGAFFECGGLGPYKAAGKRRKRG